MGGGGNGDAAGCARASGGAMGGVGRPERGSVSRDVRREGCVGRVRSAVIALL